MKRMLTLTMLVALAACDKPATPTEQKEEALQKAEDRREVATSRADNTKKNERDVDPDLDTKTPFDQGENEVDRTITATIRKEVVGDSSLSMTAKNVKIITNGGVVTLRGPVDSEKEKTNIYALAQRTSGVKRVENQLEVAN